MATTSLLRLSLPALCLQRSASAIVRKPLAACYSQVHRVAGYAHTSDGIPGSSSDHQSFADFRGRSSGSASTITYKPVTGYHVLRVHGYSLLSEVFGKGDSIESPAFDIGGHSWSLKLYPNCDSDDDDDDDSEGDIIEDDEDDSESRSHNEDSSNSAGQHVGLYLHLNSISSDGERVVYARPRFSVLDHLGNPGAVSDQGWCPFDRRLKTWGSPDWISKEELEKSEYLKDDSFALRCDVDVGLLELSQSAMVTWPNLFLKIKD